ncbi:MAG: DUF2339 domain-containing protein [Chloroflexi bacterium]|nr:DUF2339 domain-containing protein [Chloroflexota bacterium]
MICPRCQTDNHPASSFCVYCGTRLPGASARPQPRLSLLEEIHEAKAQVAALESRLSKLEQRAAAENTCVPSPSVVEPQSDSPVVSVIPLLTPVSPSETVPVMAMPQPESMLHGIPPPTPHVEEAVRPKHRASRLEDWEQVLPGNWLSRIGIVALFIGLGFLIKLAVDRDWVGPVIQVILEALVGVLLLWGGQHWKRRYPVWAQTLTGGGVAVLYLCVFSAYALQDVMPFWPTYVLMFAVTAGAVALALRQDAMAIAILGIIGAFLVPIILGVSGQPSQGAEEHRTHAGLLIPYVLLLDAGIVWLTTRRPWRWLTLLGLVSSLMVYGAWYGVYGHDGSLFVAEGGAAAIFLLFVAATMVFHVLWGAAPEPADLALMTLNAWAYFAVSYVLLWDHHRGWLGAFSLLLAAFFGLLAYLARLRSEQNRRLSQFALGIAIVFLTIAAPVQFHRAWVPVVWAAEGAVLIWISWRQDIRRLQTCGLGILGLASIQLLVFAGATNQESFRPFLNHMLPAFLATIGAFCVAAYCLRPGQVGARPWHLPVTVCMANILMIWLLSAEIVAFAGSRISAAMASGADIHRVRSLENARALALVVLWAAYGCGLLMLGMKKRWPWLRVGAYALVVIAIGMTLVELNHAHAMVGPRTSIPIINYSFAGFAVSVAALCFVGWTTARSRANLGSGEALLFLASLLGANVLLLWGLSAEVFYFVGDGHGTSAENIRALSLVMLWAAYASVLLTLGIRRKWLGLRVGAYTLVVLTVGMTLIKLNHAHAMVGRDTSIPIINYSFGAFAVSIVILCIVGWMMARARADIGSGEVGLISASMVGANVLLLWGLSAEIVAFVAGGYAVSLGLTLLWAAYALALIAVGIWRRWRSILKLFIVDTFTLKSGYRVAAYLILGILLLSAGFVYQKYAPAIKKFLTD